MSVVLNTAYGFLCFVLLWLPLAVVSIVVVWSWLLACFSVSFFFCGVTTRQKYRGLWLIHNESLEGAERCSEFSKNIHLLLFGCHFYCSLCTGCVKILKILLNASTWGGWNRAPLRRGHIIEAFRLPLVVSQLLTCRVHFCLPKFWKILCFRQGFCGLY